jgi:plasmid segregation protein ParM
VFASELMKVDGVLLAGGGSKLLFDRLSKELKGAVLLNEPRMAVAEGFCRFGVSVINKKRRAEGAAAAGAAHV